MIDELSAAVAALDLAALAVAVGVTASFLGLWPRHDFHPGLMRPFRRWLGLAIALLLFTAAAELLLRTAAMAEVELAEAFAEIPTVLFKTHYGQLWWWRLGALILLGVVWRWSLRRDRAWEVCLPAALAMAMLAALVSCAGHAGDDGVISLSNLVNALHILGGCLWGGAVIAYAWILLPALHGRVPLPHALIAQASQRLSTMAGGALALVLATGLYNAWRLVGRIPALWETEYGRILLVKLLFVTAMMAVGAFNRFRLVPAVETWAVDPSGSIASHAPQRFLRALRIDTLLFLAVLTGAAVLGFQTPASHAENGETASFTVRHLQGLI